MGKVLQTVYGLLRVVPAVARVARIGRGGWYALRIAIEGGDLRAPKKITSRKKWPRCPENPLILAARLGRASMVRHLVEVSGLESAEELTSALTVAAGTGNVELVSLLMEAISIRTNEHSKWGKRALGRALQAAASTGQLGICRLLLENAADVNHRIGELDYTSLMWSIMHRHFGDYQGVGGARR